MKTHVIIGAAAAGIGCLNTLIKLDPNSRIICISDEPENPYNKCFLADYVHKVKQEGELNILRKEVLSHPNVHLFLGIRVLAIDPIAKFITLHDETTVPYDTLFIGTGSSPLIPPLRLSSLREASGQAGQVIPGISNREGVFTFHTLADANKILAYVNDNAVKRVAVVGAGLSGLECADSLRAHGLEVTVIERGDRVLARQVDHEGAQFIAKLMAEAGIELVCNQVMDEIMCENGKVVGIKLENKFPRSSRIPRHSSVERSFDCLSRVHRGKGHGNSDKKLMAPQDFGANGVEDSDFLTAQMLIIATGLKPNSELARDSGLAVRDGYIAVNEYMQTSDESIFAGGDCVMVYDQVSKEYAPSCTWPDAMQQGSVAAQNMIHPSSKKYPGACVITSSAFFGTALVTCGPVVNPPEGADVRISRGDDYYHKIILIEDKVVGYLLIGNTQIASRLRRAMLTGENY